MTEPTWALVLRAVQSLGAGGVSFTREALVGEVQRLDPRRETGTIGPVVQGMTANAPGGSTSPCGTPLLRVARGVYQLATASDSDPDAGPHAMPVEPARQAGPDQLSADVVLVGCVKSKLPGTAPARDLYTSPLFRRRRAYAEQSGRPWFILSSRWGLVAPDEPIAAYDLYLGDQTADYRAAWGAFVVEQLHAHLGPLRGRTVEVHAGHHYRAAIDPPLRAHGATPTNPVPALGIGQTLAWYDTVINVTPSDPTPCPTPVASTSTTGPPRPDDGLPDGPIESLSTRLVDPAARLTPAQLLAQDPAQLATPGLYTWWVDEHGAHDLSHGADLTIHPGLIYAGLAGATRWPSGRRSRNTLWSRLAGMHLGGRAEFSTFRRTLAALLRGPLAMTHEDDDTLTHWMHDHLQVTPVPVHDPDTLGRIEEAILQRLDPPLNLRGMPTTPLRDIIRTRRRSS
jgi:hypothetical protein